MMLKSTKLNNLRKECLNYIENKIKENNNNLTVHYKEGGSLFVTLDYIKDWSTDNIVALCDKIHQSGLEHFDEWFYVVIKDEGKWVTYSAQIRERFDKRLNSGVKAIFLKKADAYEYIEYLNKKETV